MAAKWGILPDKPGWYWATCRHFEPTPVKVFKSKANDLLCCILPTGVAMANDFAKFQWAGPLIPPKE